MPQPLSREAPPRRSPRLLAALCVLLGVALHLPSLGAGFYADDYVLAIGLGEEGARTPLRPWSLFDFGDLDDWREVSQERGGLAWWAAPDWSIRFFRPLASLSMALDHALHGDAAAWHHLTSLLLYAALLVVAWRLYLALGLPPRAALLGLLLLALSDASVVPVGWLANRNSLLVALLSAAAVLAVARERAGRGAIVVALGLALGAALAKESGALALLLVALTLGARARTTPRGRERPARVAGAVAALGLLALYAGFLALAGYGTRSLFYATPWREPLRFLDNALTLATAGLLSLAAPFPVDAAGMVPAARWPMVAVGALLGVPLAIWIGREVARRPGAPLLAAWTAAFLAPQAATVPSDRLLFEASVGSCGLLGLFLAGLHARRADLGRGARVAALALFASATLGSGAWLFLQASGMRMLAVHLRETALATETGPPGAGPRDVVVLQTDSGFQGFTLSPTWHGAGGDPQVRFAPLNPAPRAVRWTRTAEDAFELEALDEAFLSRPFEQVYSTRPDRPARGELLASGVLEVEVAERDAAGPRVLRVRLPRSLDDPTLVFVRPVAGVLTRMAPPPIGGSLELPAPRPALPFVP